MPDRDFDRVVIGAGIVGLAVAREMLRRRPGLRIAVLEKESQIAGHQTGHNSGIIHTGVYYRPGSLKARLCVEGRTRLLRFCDERGIPYRLSGKLIVAIEEAELPRLGNIAERGRANGVEGLSLLRSEQFADYEPHVRGLAALWVPGTGVVDYRRVAAAIAEEIREKGGEILVGCEVTAIAPSPEGPVLETTAGPMRAARVVACAGLQSDRLSTRTRGREDLRIVPFRGDYYVLRPEARRLVRSMINPVPDPRFPFLGVHFTRRIDDEVLAGPNAVLALAREGYGRFRLDLADEWATFTWPGFWRLALRHWKTGAAELWRDLVKGAYARRLRRFVPEIRDEDLLPGPCGIRAQAVHRDGTLMDDFSILEDADVLQVRNAPSPAATSAFAIAHEIVDRSEKSWGLAGAGGS
jgi:L-2-hydroxyglutarate oxidase LhgO